MERNNQEIAKLEKILEDNGYDFNIEEIMFKPRKIPIEAPTIHESKSYMFGIRLVVNYPEI